MYPAVPHRAIPDKFVAPSFDCTAPCCLHPLGLRRNNKWMSREGREEKMILLDGAEEAKQCTSYFQCEGAKL